MTPRLTALPFPSYTYVPGKQPHPHREAGGHSFGEPEPRVSHFDPHRWQECEAYLFGFDLFNHGYYWEAHEQWEAVWVCVGRVGVIADFVKGLIKLAAAGVKAKEGKPVGVDRHLARAVDLFMSVQPDNAEMVGLQIAELVKNTQTECRTTAIQQSRLNISLVPTG